VEQSAIYQLGADQAGRPGGQASWIRKIGAYDQELHIYRAQMID